jgi:hypothetical protein
MVTIYCIYLSVKPGFSPLNLLTRGYQVLIIVSTSISGEEDQQSWQQLYTRSSVFSFIHMVVDPNTANTPFSQSSNVDFVALLVICCHFLSYGVVCVCVCVSVHARARVRVVSHTSTQLPLTFLQQDNYEY